METQLKQLISTAQKSNDTITKDVLRLVLGQIQSDSSIKTLSEDQKFSIVRKIIKSNEITLAAMAETQKENWNQNWQDNANKLLHEIKILNSLLPEVWTIQKIAFLLQLSSKEIQEAKSDGQAIGIAMKSLSLALKMENASVNGSDVKSVVLQMRQTNS